MEGNPAVAHLHFRQTVYKGGGSKAADRVSYITRTPAHDLTQDATRAAHALAYIEGRGPHAGREDVVHTASHNLPAWAHGNPVAFFSTAERREGARHVGPFATGKEPTAFSEWKISLPRELTIAQNVALAQAMLQETLGTTHPYTYAVHNPPAVDGHSQIHLHVLFSARTLDGLARTPEQFFTRYNATHPDRGGAQKDPAFSHMGAVFATRQLLCDLTNLSLERHGHSARLDPRSLAARGLDRTPEPKLLPSDSHALKTRYEVTPAMQDVFDHRFAREPLVAAEQAQARQAWTQRKRELGLTDDLPLAVALGRIRAARLAVVTQRPGVVRGVMRGVVQRSMPVRVRLAAVVRRRSQDEVVVGGALRVRLRPERERGMGW